MAEARQDDGPCSGLPPGSVIAIDGPSGAGKSTVARRLARRLGIAYLDSGALYRAIAWKALEARVDVDDEKEMAELLRTTQLVPDTEESDAGTRVQVDGRWLEAELRSSEVSSAASNVATLPAVRTALTAVQRRSVPRCGAVVEGRDIGTVVFPDTRYKFFLDARVEVRAERRSKELRSGGGSQDTLEVAAELERRDRRDRERSLSPLRRDPSYRVIDTSELTIDEVVHAMEIVLREQGGGVSP